MEKHLTEGEIERLLSIIDNIEDKLLIAFGIESGCRVSEAVTLQTANIDNERQIARVWDEKKDLWREIVLPRNVLQLIRMALNARQKAGPLLFPFSYKTANRTVKKWCQRAGIPPQKAHWHTFRHTYIVQSRLRGRDFKAVQQQTGDSELTLLRVYSTLTPEERIKDAEARPIIKDGYETKPAGG